MNISVVIPNYNGENLLKKNLPKVIEELDKYKNGKVEIIVVDDASSDESLSVLSDFKKEYKNLEIVLNKKNLGFSSTVNNGANHTSGDIILLLNSDVHPQNNFLESLLSHFNDDKVFAVGSMDRSIEGEKTILRGRGLGSWRRGFLVHRRGEVDKTSTLWVSGGSGAFRKSIWDKLGGLNGIYNPFYWEDIDLSYRAQKSGYKVSFEPKSIVFHEHDQGSIKSSYSPFKIKTIAYRNQFIFVWGNVTDFNLRVAHIIFIPYHFVKALIRLDVAFFIGFFEALIMLPKVIEFKLKAEKQFVKKDKEVIAAIQE